MSSEIAPQPRYGYLSVGPVARVLGISPSTLRLWESEGLVAPERTPGGYRMYSPELVTLLKRIKYLRDVQGIKLTALKRELRRAEKSTASKAPRSSNSSRGVGQLLGPQLRRMRTARRLTVAEAAKQAGLSPGFLSAVERSRANASVAALQRLAAVYGTTVMALFRASPHQGRLVGLSERSVLEVHPGVRMELLSVGAPLLQSMIFRVAPLAGSEGAYSHEGEEFILMLSGSLEVWLDELYCFVLREGDSFWFPSTHSHRWTNPGDVEAVLVWINTPPTF